MPRPRPSGAALEAIADLDRRLWTLVAEGRAAWPDLAARCARRSSSSSRASSRADLADAALDGLRPADLYLACACAQRLPAAIDAFDRDYMREVDIALARMRIGGARLDDVKQLVRQRLFVGGGTAGRADERRARLASTAGAAICGAGCARSRCARA